uniref:Transmembrane protein 176A-like n=1 Tax=Cyprinus carpio TaxID=7962 RepID=A0A8C1KHW3_CYPCA
MEKLKSIPPICRMPLTVSQGEGMMVITIPSNPKSKWPIMCQILSSLCYGPVCFASEDMKEKLTDTQRVTGIVQIVVAVMNLVLGCFGIIFFIITTSVNSMVLSVLQLCVVVSFCILTIKSLCKKGGSAELVGKTTKVSRSGISQYSLPFGCSCSMTLASSQDMKDKLTDIHTALGSVQIMVGVMNITMGCFGFIFSFCIGGVFLVVGIMCVLAVKFSRPKLLVITVILNVVSAALAITAAVLYSLDLAMGSSSSCYREHDYYSSNNDWFTHKMSVFDPCFYYKNLSQMIRGGLDITMIVLSVLQLCVTISFCVLTGKALWKKDEDVKSVEDPELHKPLLEDATAGAAC